MIISKIKKLFLNKGKDIRSSKISIDPSFKIKGKDVIESLTQNPKTIFEYSHEDIYIALENCKELISISCHYIHIDEEWETYSIPLSGRQYCCANTALLFIIEGDYQRAFEEFCDCIDDYERGLNRKLSKNEFILYNCILSCFMQKLEPLITKNKMAKEIQ